VDLANIRVLEEHDVAEDPDVLAYDAGLKRLYVASESGVLTVFSTAGTRLVRLGTYTAPQAHTVAVNPANHEVYLPLANVKGRPVLRILAPADSRSAK
jgi:DNA-binding beta-propeller fold protein YncE